MTIVVATFPDSGTRARARLRGSNVVFVRYDKRRNGARRESELSLASSTWGINCISWSHASQKSGWTFELLQLRASTYLDKFISKNDTTLVVTTRLLCPRLTIFFTDTSFKINRFHKHLRLCACMSQDFSSDQNWNFGRVYRSINGRDRGSFSFCPYPRGLRYTAQNFCTPYEIGCNRFNFTQSDIRTHQGIMLMPGYVYRDYPNVSGVNLPQNTQPYYRYVCNKLTYHSWSRFHKIILAVIHSILLVIGIVVTPTRDFQKVSLIAPFSLIAIFIAMRLSCALRCRMKPKTIND